MTVTLPARYQGWADDIVAVVAEVAAADEFILKSRVSNVENAIAGLTGARHAIACANGTGAMVLALTALGIGAGDEVITPAFSFISSASAIALVGAVPVFADVDLETATLNPAAASAVITSRTKAILPVHLFSQVAPMPELSDLASERDLAVIEDSAVALGGKVAGRPAGRWGDIGLFSFFPAKPLGTCGDGGMLITDADDLAATLRALRNHGQSQRFRHDLVGFNCRMDEVVAGFLLRQLPRLGEFRQARRSLAEHYSRALQGLAPHVRLLTAGPADQSVYTYVVRVEDRAGLRKHLAAHGVQTAVTYPRPLHLQPVFAHLGHHPEDFPHATQLASECLALPLYPELQLSDVDKIIELIEGFYR